MRPFAVLDSETDPFKQGRIPEPFVWGFYDGLMFRHFTHDTAHSMIEWIADQKIIVYAHNGGKFDYHFLLPYMEPYDHVKIINDRLAQYHLEKGMATHSSILAWRIPWTEEPGRLSSMETQRVIHN